jgi:hypothetical protein
MRALLMLLVVIAGCAPITDPDNFALITNDTDRAVILYIAHPDGEVEIGALAPGESEPRFRGECAESPLIARLTDGTEVARREPPFCSPDEWIITRREGS